MVLQAFLKNTERLLHIFTHVRLLQIILGAVAAFPFSAGYASSIGEPARILELTGATGNVKD